MFCDTFSCRVAAGDISCRRVAKTCGAGVLREQAFGKEKLFVHPKLMSLLTSEGHNFEPYRRSTA